MANETTEILRIVFDADDAIKKTADLKKQRDALKQANKELQKAEGDNSVAIEKNIAAIKALDQTIRNNEKQTQLLIKANTAAAGSYEQLLREQQLAEIELKNTEGLLKRNADGTVQFSQAYFDASKKVDDLKQAVLLFNGGISQGAQNVGNYGNTLEGLRNRLADLQKEIQTTDVGSDRFKEAQDEAGNLTLQIGQLEGKLDEFGNREPKNPAKRAFEDTIATAGALTSAIQITTLAFDENDGVSQKLAQGVQAIAIAQNVANIVKEKGAIIDTLTLKNFRSLTAVQGAYGVVVGTSTGALKLFRLALAATGIGALIAGIGLLVANFDKIKKSVESLIQPFTDFLGLTSQQERDTAAVTAEYEKQLSTVEQLTNQEEIRFDIVIEGLNRQLKIAKSLGKDTNAIEKQIASEREKSLKEQERLTNEAIANIIKIGINTEAAALKYQKLQEVLRETRKEILNVTNDETARLNERSIAISKQAAEINKLREIVSRPLKDIEFKLTTKIDTTARDKQLEEEQIARLRSNQETEDKITLQRAEAINNRIATALEFERQYGIQEEELYAEFARRRDEIQGQSFEFFLNLKAKEIEAQKKAAEEILNIATNFTSQVADLFIDTLTQQGQSLETFAKRFIVLLLDILEKQVTASIISATTASFAQPDSVLTFGATGVARAAILTGLIKAAFGVAKSALSVSPKFATGVVGLNGAGNETSDSIPAYLSRGESVITARGTRFAQTNYPGLLEFLNTRNKFADGVVNFSNSPVPSAIPNVGEQVRAALQDLTIVTKVTDIEKSISDRQSVRNVGVI